MIADHSYGPVKEIQLPESQKFLIFECSGISLSTRPEQMAYVYRTTGDQSWRTTYDRRVEYKDISIGSHRFSFRAVDRDLNYSDVVEVKVEVVPDPRDEQIDELEMRVRERTHELAKLNNELEHRVEERTANLTTANEQLRAFAARLEESNRELQDFAYVSSHDLQEPLRKIQAFGDRLGAKEAENLSKQGQDYIWRMKDAAARMQILINDLLSFSRVTTKGKAFVQVDLESTVGEVESDLEVLIEESGGKLSVGDLPVIEADPTQMHQLLQNLIANALKFRTETPPMIRISAHIDNPVCELVVEDNGIGFEEKYLDRIFSPFQRLHGRSEFVGTGMGLAICRKIVQRHNGSITAQSEPGKGATFKVRLPLKQPSGDR